MKFREGFISIPVYGACMKPVVLLIMDGFGLRDEVFANAIAGAKKPNLDRLIAACPHTTLGASGRDVGLPTGQMGNSEVGHLNLGAGRVVYQDYTRISLAIEQDQLRKNQVLVRAMKDLGEGRLHLMGLLSDGGVHSHISHLMALLDLARDVGVNRCYIHSILDGRDVPPRSALSYLDQLEEKTRKIGLGQVATVSGRYYTMDRDRRWDRTALAYAALVDGQGERARSAREAVLAGYERGENDEFLRPTVVDQDGMIRDGDSVIFFNFRPDRARQITRAIVQADFSEFSRHRVQVRYVCMTQYDSAIDAPVAFPVQYLHNTLGEVASSAGRRQLRIAETEKYAHVTYFFNGGSEEPMPGEDRVLIPSPRVATYDLLPEMSAYQVTDAVLERIRMGIYDMIVMNYANPDMVGHTGIYQAAVKAVETVDACLGRVVEAVQSCGGSIAITADHGNAEKMSDEETGQAHTAHTTNRVPFILVGAGSPSLREDGILADVAPTILELMGLHQPQEMSGRSLIAPSAT